jgi:hypothetical protein
MAACLVTNVEDVGGRCDKAAAELSGQGPFHGVASGGSLLVLAADGPVVRWTPWIGSGDTRCGCTTIDREVVSAVARLTNRTVGRLRPRSNGRIGAGRIDWLSPMNFSLIRHTLRFAVRCPVASGLVAIPSSTALRLSVPLFSAVVQLAKPAGSGVRPSPSWYSVVTKAALVWLP